jgi:hemoglobin
MKHDIETKEDIETLVNTFYSKVIDDPTIGYIFKNSIGFSFEKHIPIMVSFWETLLFGVMSYKGNPMIKHIELNKTIPLHSQHFTQWLALWDSTIQENFEGKNANEAISKARNIAGIMQLKINIPATL